MSDEPTTPVAEAAAPEAIAAPAAEPPVSSPPARSRSRAKTTPEPPAEPESLVESRAAVKSIGDEIDALWAEAEGRAPKTLLGEDPAPEPEPAVEPPKAETVAADAPKSEPTKAETPAQPDQAEIERAAEEKVRARINAEREAEQAAERRIRADADHRKAADAYVGAETDYAAVNAALRASMAGDHALLDSLDVVLPNGKTSSAVKGTKGLTQEEAANLLTAWDTARGFESVLGDRKVQRIVDYWNSEVTSAGVLDHPDVDMAAVTKHPSPPDQMRALRDSVIERVTQRLTAQHATEIKAKDAEIERLNQRVTSLTTERTNLTSQQRAAEAGSIDRPGQPGAIRTGLPDTDEVAGWSSKQFDDALKDGTVDQIWQRIEGGLSRPRRRAG